MVLIEKHTGLPVAAYGLDVRGILRCIQDADAQSVVGLVAEIVERNEALRALVSPKYLFEQRFGDLSRWLAHDGWEVEGGQLVTGPAVEETTGLRDILLENLRVSPLDSDGAIRGALELSASAFTDNPPRYNDSATNVGIALENVRAAFGSAPVRRH